MSDRFPHLHLLVGEPLGDAETLTRIRAIDDISPAPRVTSREGEDLVLVWPASGVYVKCAKEPKGAGALPAAAAGGGGAGNARDSGSGSGRRVAKIMTTPAAANDGAGAGVERAGGAGRVGAVPGGVAGGEDGGGDDEDRRGGGDGTGAAATPLSELVNTAHRRWFWLIVAAGIYAPNAADAPWVVGGSDGGGGGARRTLEQQSSDLLTSGSGYPGPSPGNVTLGTPRRKALDALARLKLRPRRSGVAMATLRPYDRFDLAPGELKCSFDDGLPRRHGEPVRYSAALGNSRPISLLLSFSGGADNPAEWRLTRSTFLSPEELARLEAVSARSVCRCEPYDPARDPRRLLFTDPPGSQSAIDTARVEAYLDVTFGRDTRTAVEHHFAPDAVPFDVCTYGPDPRADRPHCVIVSQGVSSRPMPLSSSGGSSSSAQGSTGAGLSRQGSSGSLLSSGAPGAAAAGRAMSAASGSFAPPQRRGSSVGVGNALPASADPNPLARVEVLLYCEDPRPEYAGWVTHVARVATGYRDPTGKLFHGQVLQCPRGTQAKLANGQAVEALLVINASAGAEGGAHEELRAGEGSGEPVKMMVIIPITSHERNRAAEIVEKLGKFSTPVVFRESRPAYVI